MIDLGEQVRRRIEEVNAGSPGSIAEMLNFQFVEYDHARDEVVMTCETMPWMRNSAGTLHGGLCATILDQAMGYVVYCVKAGDGAAPTVQLEIRYHRPLHPGEQVIVKVHVVSVTRSLMNLTAEAYQAARPEKICVSGSGIYFFKPQE
ncbi:MAG: PaaI family thioesterase [Eubacteriales bacterium]|nr:PaaI family thioesterase [Eubacteriales bacterium]